MLETQPALALYLYLSYQPLFLSALFKRGSDTHATSTIARCVQLSPTNMGNPASPALVSIPAANASLDQGGLNVAMAEAARNPVAVQAAIAELQSNPKAVVAKFFNLNGAQYTAISQMTDAEVTDAARPIITAMEESKFTGWKISFQRVADMAVAGRSLDVSASELFTPLDDSGIEMMRSGGPFPHIHIECKIDVG